MTPNATGQVAVSAAASIPLLSRCICCNSGNVTIQTSCGKEKLSNGEAVERIQRIVDDRLYSSLDGPLARYHSKKAKDTLNKNGVNSDALKRVQKRFKKIGVQSPLKIV